MTSEYDQRIIDNLAKSREDEVQAQQVYKERKDEGASDVKTAEVYAHVIKEEAEHEREFGERLMEKTEEAPAVMPKISYPTIDELAKDLEGVVPDAVLRDVKNNFTLAVNQAKACNVGKMVDNLVMLGSDLDDVFDALATAIRKDQISDKEWKGHIQKVESFTWGQVTRTMKQILTENCSCKVND